MNKPRNRLAHVSRTRVQRIQLYGKAALYFAGERFELMQCSADLRAALVIAHPGHELRVNRWLEVARPLVFVLTDGSGQLGSSRLNSTTKIISQAGANIGPIFGRFTDKQIYASILESDVSGITGLVTELAESLLQNGVEYVAGDASEGYNPAHDLCRLVLNAAVELIRKRTSSHLGNFDFPLTGRPDNCHYKLRKRAIRLHLDDLAFARKVRIAESYPELLQEIGNTVRENGIDAFRNEYLRPVCDFKESYVLKGQPFYERYGERPVAAGFYSKVLRYRQHMLPLAEALRRFVELGYGP